MARHLEQLGHSVAVIDRDAAAFRRLGEDFAGAAVTGEGFDQDTLIAAGIERADAFAAVSSGDNSNIISARVARELFNVRSVVARIYDSKRAEVYERLGIPTVATVPWTATRLLQMVMGESAIEQWRDPSGAVVMLRLVLHDAWAGRRLSELETATGARLAYVTRFGAGQLPTASTVAQDGDVVHVLAPEQLIDTVRRVAAQPPEGGLS